MIEITKQVRALAGMADALRQLVEAGDKINSLEQFESENAARVEKLRQAAVDAERKRDEALAASVNHEKEAARIVATAEDQAAEIVESAGRDAKRIRDEADAELHRTKGITLQMVADAKAIAEREEARAAEAIAQREGAEAKLAELKAAIVKITGG